MLLSLLPAFDAELNVQLFEKLKDVRGLLKQIKSGQLDACFIDADKVRAVGMRVCCRSIDLVWLFVFLFLSSSSFA